MSMQFVSCSATGCPFNESKQCRAPFIAVDANGRCQIMEGGPFDGKSPVENYVDVRSCACERCAHFEKDLSTDEGVCGQYTSLFFSKVMNISPKIGEIGVQPEGTSLAPICMDFAKQIDAPAFSAKI